MAKRSYVDVDALARNLGIMGAQAAMMPPAFMGGGVKDPIIAPGTPFGSTKPLRLGWVLPGKGIALDRDLAELGIRRPIRNVYEPSLINRLLDMVGNERGAITKYDDIVNARAAGNFYDSMWGKASLTTVANQWSTLFQATGMPGAGTYTAIPTGAIVDCTNPGALTLGMPQPGSSASYLAGIGCLAAQQLNWIVFADLLVACGSILATTASSQTVTSATLTRYASNAANVMMALHVTTALGTGTPTATITYTNSAGSTGKTTSAVMTASAIIHRMMPGTIGLPFPLASGDFGVKAVASLQLSGTMTAGAFALNIYKPLTYVPGLGANVYGEKDTSTTIETLCPLVADSGSSNVGCLVAYVLPNATSTGIVNVTTRTLTG